MAQRKKKASKKGKRVKASRRGIKKTGNAPRNQYGCIGDQSRAAFEEWRGAFLEGYAEEKVIGGGCRRASISYPTFKKWYEADEEFAAQCDAIRTHVDDRLETNALERGTDGWQEPVFHQGNIVGFKQVFDNRLTTWLLERRRKKPYHIKTITDEGGALDQIGEMLRNQLAAMDDTVAKEGSDGDE